MSYCFSRVTNTDGKVPNLLTQEQFLSGKYMMRFETEAYFKEIGVSSYFYPYVEVIPIMSTAYMLSQEFKQHTSNSYLFPFFWISAITSTSIRICSLFL